MPLYEYRCSECSAEFEEIVPYAKADDVVCSVCSSDQVERRASAIASCCKTSGSQEPESFCSRVG